MIRLLKKNKSKMTVQLNREFQYTMKLNLVVCIIVTLIMTISGVSFARDKDEKTTNIKSKAAGKVVKKAAKGAAVGAAAVGGVVGKITDEPGKGAAVGAAAVGAKKILGKDDKDSKRKDGLLNEKPMKGLKNRK